MNIQEIIDQYQPVTIQIATQSGTGTGFYLKGYDLIVTNQHVVGGFPEVIIKGKTFPKMLSRVYLTDTKHDLAFLQPPPQAVLPEVPLGNYGQVQDGDHVIAIGHPFGLNYTATQGVVSKAGRVREGLKFIQIDAAINPGNSGGPLVNRAGEIVGINSFVIRGGDNLGFALPVSYLQEALDKYLAYRGEAAVLCSSCEFLVTAANLEQEEYCPSCGTRVLLPRPPRKEPEQGGVARTIEEILQLLGKDIRLARNGPHQWEVEEGSASIRISFNPENRMISGDAQLCQLPHRNIAPLYEYLLRENYTLEGMVLSVLQQHVLLSTLIYDQDLQKEAALHNFRDLFHKADYYDDILKSQFGCSERLMED